MLLIDTTNRAVQSLCSLPKEKRTQPTTNYMQINYATLQNCLDALLADGVVGMPTETVYGLAANACSATAIAHVFQAKSRPTNHPLIVHVASSKMAWSFIDVTQPIPAFVQCLMDAFWPGPLTLILPRQPNVAAAAAGNHPSIGLRCPAHPVALALLDLCVKNGILGLAAPSANQFGRISPTTADHVAQEFSSTNYANLPILNGGACQVGIESTIVDCTRGFPVILRPGVLTQFDLAKTLAPMGIEVLCVDDSNKIAAVAPAPSTSGNLASHYAPRAKLRLMDAMQLQSALMILHADADADAKSNIAIYHRSPLPTALTQHHTTVTMPNDALQAAHELFATLRALDMPHISLIWLEVPPSSAEWVGVADRVKRAAA